MKQILSYSALAALATSSVACAQQPKMSEKPNVLFIMCDDLNDYEGVFGGHPNAITPNIDKLAQSGTRFVNGHTNVALSSPSRNSLFTGVYPHSARDFGWTDFVKNPRTKGCTPFVRVFRDNGYRTLGTGKLLHQEKMHCWTDWGVDRRINYAPNAWDGEKIVGHPSVNQPFRDVNITDGSFASLADIPTWVTEKGDTIVGGWSYGATGIMNYVDDDNRDPMPDEMHVQWAKQMIEQMDSLDSDQPFFMGVGFVKPHTPMYAPQKYFDMFPLDEIDLPVRLDDDMADCFYRSVYNDETTMGLQYYAALKASYPEDLGLRLFLQAYLACTAFVDDQIGELVDALDNSRFKDNTIVIFVSDHGWQMGEKEYIYKNSLWEESTRIPYIIRHPELSKAGSKVTQPVSLIDIYPTLLDMCSLEYERVESDNCQPLDGHSLVPLLSNPKAAWGGQGGVLTMAGVGIDTPIEGIGRISNPHAKWHVEIIAPLGEEYILQQNYALRTEDFRYIRYHNGKEELYDHRKDEYEWHNLVDDKKYRSILESLRKEMMNRLGQD